MAIEGCEVCWANLLERLGIRPHQHVIVTQLSVVEKSCDIPWPWEQVERVKKAIWESASTTALGLSSTG